MRDIPIIFSAPMVKALLAGRKTMTRRLAHRKSRDGIFDLAPSPWQRVEPGDALWVRENLQFFGTPGGDASIMFEPLHYAADEQVPGAVGPAITVPAGWRLPNHGGEKIPSIHMPRWASRLTLEVTAVKIERLQDITPEDAESEGVWYSSAEYREQVCIWRDCAGALQKLRVKEFANLWKRLHGDEAWDANPEVVAISFRPHQINIDQFLRERAAA